MTRVVSALAFAALYLGVLGSVALADVAMALAVGALLALAFTSGGELRGVREALRRLVFLPLFFIGVALEVLRGAARMALVVLGVRDWRRQGVIDVVLGARSSVGISVSALVTGLSPSSVVVDIDYAEGVMLVHVIDASDPDAVQRGLRRFYERFQRAVFP